MAAERGDPSTRTYGRRAFIAVTAFGLSSLLWGRPLWDVVSRGVQPLSSALPEGLVPSQGWRIYTVASSMPSFDPRTWRLKVDGLVSQPHSFTYAQLRSLPRTEQVSTFHCVTGWSVADVRWTGVRLRDLLSIVRPRATARVLSFVSAEKPYVDTLTLAQASLDDVLLAYEMDGKPLPRAHGAPVRLVIPEMYGYKNVKWVERIVLEHDAVPGYWEQRGYDTDAWVGRSNGL